MCHHTPQRVAGFPACAATRARSTHEGARASRQVAAPQVLQKPLRRHPFDELDDLADLRVGAPWWDRAGSILRIVIVKVDHFTGAGHCEGRAVAQSLASKVWTGCAPCPTRISAATPDCDS